MDWYEGTPLDKASALSNAHGVVDVNSLQDLIDIVSIVRGFNK